MQSSNVRASKLCSVCWLFVVAPFSVWHDVAVQMVDADIVLICDLIDILPFCTLWPVNRVKTQHLASTTTTWGSSSRHNLRRPPRLCVVLLVYVWESMGPRLLYLSLRRWEGVETSDLRSAL